MEKKLIQIKNVRDSLNIKLFKIMILPVFCFYFSNFGFFKNPIYVKFCQIRVIVVEKFT
jgi:hypothetical protein